MIKKMTKGRFLDILCISLLLSFSLGIILTNYGEYPYSDKVDSGNLIATVVYISVWGVSIYLSYLLSRERLLRFQIGYLSVSSVVILIYFIFANVLSLFDGNFTTFFSTLSLIFVQPMIGIYYFISPPNAIVFSCVAFVCSALLTLEVLLFSFKKWGYFERLRSSRKPKALTGVKLMQKEIKESREKKAQSKKENK